MLSRTVFLLVFLILFCPLTAREEPLSIVIVGGGPAGLATAIEAKAAGANVTIVEKRERYSREQFVFLLESILDLLDSWGVRVPDLLIGQDAEERIGFTRIKNLEIGLAQRVKELGIPIILGEFQECGDKKIVIAQKNQKRELSYDLLVGADGTDSQVRKNLCINSHCFGQALGAIYALPISRENSDMEFILPFRSNSLFINKIIVPSATIISAQADDLTIEMLVAEAQKAGLLDETIHHFSGKVKCFDKIEVVLQQALAFSDSSKSVILLGDAAASASFLQGMGVESALESARIAGRLFKTELHDSDYAAFDRAMKVVTDRLIADSAFLFN